MHLPCQMAKRASLYMNFSCGAASTASSVRGLRTPTAVTSRLQCTPFQRIPTVMPAGVLLCLLQVVHIDGAGLLRLSGSPWGMLQPFRGFVIENVYVTPGSFHSA